jgi:KUP system potassium uptake protein
MSTDIAVKTSIDPLDPPMDAHPHHEGLGRLALGAIGIVFGDIGTSPLYAFRETFAGHHRLEPSPENILGVLSLIFWSMMVVVTVKYVMIIMRADNKGEGGSLALLALISRSGSTKVRWTRGLILLGVFATALFYGDSMITPAMSVLTAVEGLAVVSHGFAPFVLPIALAILFGLFTIQSRGVGKVGLLFGPIMILYFVTLAGLGIMNIVARPDVFFALNPWHAVRFFLDDGIRAFLAMGSVVLAVTGAEALYADMGHFGRKPIGISWLVFVLPALMLNYLGQGAMILAATPEQALALVHNPFFFLAPVEWRLPLVILATMATIIASQAVISGAFSVTQQAIQLGFMPRLRIIHTSSRAAGQIYIPSVNWALMVMVMLLVVTFRSSSNLAAAYGIAVSGAMMIDSCLIGVVLFGLWKWKPWFGAPLLALFLLVDFAYLAANLTKVPAADRLHHFHLPHHMGARPGAHDRADAGGDDAGGRIRPLGRRLGDTRVRHRRLHDVQPAWCAPCAAAQSKAQQGSARARHPADREDRGCPLHRSDQAPELGGSGPGLLAPRRALRFHGRSGRARRARPYHRMWPQLQDDGDQLLPRPADAHRLVPARHGDLARETVRLDAAQRGKRDGILPPAH